MKYFKDDKVCIVTSNAEKLASLKRGFCLIDSDWAGHNGIRIATEFQPESGGPPSIHCSCQVLTGEETFKDERLGYLSQVMFDSLVPHTHDGCDLQFELRAKDLIK